MRYESTDWSIDVAGGWMPESDETCTTFERPDGFGAVQVSSYRKDDAVTDDDLRDFAGDLPLAAISIGNLKGFYTRVKDDDRFWAKWWLRTGRQMIHVTYNCALSDRGREGAQVDSMVQSLIPKYRQEEA